MLKMSEKSHLAIDPVKTEVISTNWFDIMQMDRKAEEEEILNKSNIKEEIPVKIEIENNDIQIKEEWNEIEPKFEDITAKEEIKREIEIELLDTSNEVKYDRLISEQKLKTPFKRRFSHGSSNSNDSLKEEGSQEKDFKNKTRRIDYSFQSNKPYQRQHNSSSCSSNRNATEYETDPIILARRQKQIDYGKNTVGYDNYINTVRKEQREKEHPRTPNKNIKYSRRAFDGLIKIWRQKLHVWDTHSETEDSEMSDDDLEI